MWPANAFNPSASSTSGSGYLLTTARTNSAVSGFAPMPGPTARARFSSPPACPAGPFQSANGDGALFRFRQRFRHQLHAQRGDDRQRASGSGHCHQSRARSQCGARSHGGGPRLAHRPRQQSAHDRSCPCWRRRREAWRSRLHPAAPYSSGEACVVLQRLGGRSDLVHHPFTHAVRKRAERRGQSWEP